MGLAMGFTAERMLAIENSTVISGTVNGTGDLILMTKGGTVVNAGRVKGSDATALLGIIDSSTVDLSLTGAGTPASPWQLSASVAIASDTVQGLVELATIAETVAGTDVARAVTPAALKGALDSGVDRIRLNALGDASVTSTDHGFQIGPTSGLNLIMDQNELMARNNGVGAGLTLNGEGGDMTIGHSSAKITIPGHLVLSGSSRVLFNGPPAFMHGTQSVTLSEKVTDQANGIVIVWSRYSAGAAVNDSFTYDFVPKWHVQNQPGAGVVFMAPVTNTNPATPVGLIVKYMYIGDTTITGNDINDDAAAANRVIRAVVGV